MIQVTASGRNCRKICFVLVCVASLSHQANTQKCPQLLIQSAKLNNDTPVPKTMYRPSWPQNVTIYQRVLPVSPSRVTPFLDNQSATKGAEIIDPTLLDLPNTVRIVDVSVRVRAVQKRAVKAPQAPVVELGTWHPRPPNDAYEICRLAEYGIDPNKLDSVPYPVIGVGSSASINWSDWVPHGSARITLSNNDVVLSFDSIEGTWDHRFFWDGVVYYSRE